MRALASAFCTLCLFLIGVVSCAPTSAQAPTPAKWSMAALGPDAAVAGKTFDAQVSLTIDPGWKVYSLTQKPPPNALTITVSAGQPFKASGPPSGPLPHIAFDPNFSTDTEVHKEDSTFQVPVTSEPGANLAGASLRLIVRFQTCNERLCLPPKDVELTATSVTGTAGLPAVASAKAGTTATSGGSARVPDLAASQASTLGAYIALAALMGALSLLTPCVFPMVPITVSYFTNRQGRTRRDAITEALVYGLGIVLTFTAVGFVLAVAFGASGLSRFAANPWLNIGVTTLFVAFALSLFGVWEIALPSGLVNAAARADAGKGRFVGTLLMGLAFTLTSFTCTAPFLGTLLVVAAQGDWQWPLAGMLAFSSVFAAPFVALALAPHWLKSLPRSGGWLIAVKAVMGMAELAAAMKFLSNVDLVWHWGIFTRNVVLVSWIVIALILVLYLAGLIPLGRAPRLARPRGGRLLASAATLALAVWLGAGLTGRRLGELEAFLPPIDNTAAVARGEQHWLTSYEDALAIAAKTNRPVLVNFTGYTCTNCRWMEANMFTRPEIARELSRFVLVELFTDGRDELNQRYQQLEQDLFGTVALPYYAILGPDGTPKVAFGGLTRSSDEYLNFLRY
jgi:thiol:disulfide interchange protein DsbD